MNALSCQPEGRSGRDDAPIWIDGNADLSRCAEILVSSKNFEESAVCGSENHLVVDERICAAFCRELEQLGAALLRPAEVERLHAVLFEDGTVTPALRGSSAAAVARCAGIERTYPIRVLVAPLPFAALSGPFGREKQLPVLLLCVARSDAGATRLRVP